MAGGEKAVDAAGPIRRVLRRFFGAEPPVPEKSADLWRDVLTGPLGPQLRADLARRARLMLPTGQDASDGQRAYWDGKRALASELLHLAEGRGDHE